MADLNAVVSNMYKMLRRLIGVDIELVTLLDSALAPVRVDLGQIEQVIMNLVINAHDAMPAGGKLLIRTANAELDQSTNSADSVIPPGAYVVLEVTDTGHGMDSETQARIFEPFFTTKEPGKGTGLGLATFYGIVKQSGGYILIDSRLGQGTTFKIYLPPAPEQAEAVPSARSRELPGGSETILLVEDEELVRRLVSQTLKQGGYRVLEARHGGEALAVAEQYPGIIDLLMTDAVMPQMSGPAAAKQLAEARPHMKVLYISGYTGQVLDEGAVFLEKPFTVDALARKVRQVLDSPES